MLIRVQLFAAPWTVACQASLSMGFPRQEYCSGVPFPIPGDLPDPGIKPMSPALQADSLPTWEAYMKKLRQAQFCYFILQVLRTHVHFDRSTVHGVNWGLTLLHFTGDTSESSVVAPCAQCILGA